MTLSPRTRQYLVAGAILLAALLVLYLPKLLPSIQQYRADSLLAAANRHVENAGELQGAAGSEILDVSGFTSLESIDRSREAVSATAADLDAAAAEIDAAEAAVAKAASLSLLPEDQRRYLEKKRQSAQLRREQLDILGEAVGKLEELYDSAPLIFSSMEEMDRLLGRFETAMGDSRSHPGDAIAELDEISVAMRDIEKRLRDGYEEKGFDLLKRMADNVAEVAAMVEGSRQLAGAVAAGDQAAVENAASALEQQLLSTSVGVDYLDLWFRLELRPLKNDYDQLQEQQERLDAEAAGLYARGW